MHIADIALKQLGTICHLNVIYFNVNNNRRSMPPKKDTKGGSKDKPKAAKGAKSTDDGNIFI